MAGLLVSLAVIVALLIGIVHLIRSRSARRVNGIAMMTALHDFQPADKQRATETVIELQAGKKWREPDQGAGEGKETKTP